MYNISALSLYGGRVLTGLAQGYCTGSPLVGAFIAPVVPVNCITGGIIRYGKEAFVIEQTLRAQGTKPRTINSRFGADTYTLEQHALGYEISLEDLDAAGCLQCANSEGLNLREIEIAAIQRKLMLGHEAEVMNLVTAPSTYETTNYFAGITNAIAGAQNWNSATSTPIGNVLGLQSQVRRQIGCRFNSIILGASTYERLLDHPQIVGRIAYNTSDAIGTDAIAKYFGVRSVMVADSVAADANGNLASIFPDNAFLGFYSPNPGQSVVNLNPTSNVANPSSFYTYMKQGGLQFSQEKYYDITSNGDSADVVRAVGMQSRKVLPVGLGGTGRVSSAIYIANVFA
jgi:hypothetical protein